MLKTIFEMYKITWPFTDIAARYYFDSGAAVAIIAISERSEFSA